MLCRNNIILIIVSSFFTGLAHHPLSLGFFTWFSLVPLILVLNKINRLFDFIKVGFIWGIIYNLIVIFWLSMNIGTSPLIGFISMISAVLYCSISYFIICFLIGILKLRYRNKWEWVIPFVWVSIEYIRHKDILSGGPWTSLANTQIDFITLIQNAELTGIYGISFWIVLLNVFIYKWIIKPYKNYLYFLTLVFVLPWLSGFILLQRVSLENKKNIDISLVQPNINLIQKWNPNRIKDNIQLLLDLSQSSVKDSVSLIIWPESAIPGYILQGNKGNIKWIQSRLGTSNLLTGIPYYIDKDQERSFYNSVVLISKSFISEPYHKMVLVPLGEYVPFSSYFPKLKKINFGQANFTSGKDYVLFKINNINIAAMVCFESTIPDLNAEFVRKGAEILVYVVNDGWYQTPPEPQQHANQAIYRAIENRRSVIRASNTGISMVINPKGNIIDSIQLNDFGIITSQVAAMNGFTFYTKFGDVFAKINVIVLLLLIIGLLNKKNEN